MLRNRDIFRSLERISTTDQLTGVGNRRGFAEYRQTLPDGISLAFIFGDLNGLEQINDTQGHEVGDQLIRQATEESADINKLRQVKEELEQAYSQACQCKPEEPQQNQVKNPRNQGQRKDDVIDAEYE